jgi:hypothetical protein
VPTAVLVEFIDQYRDRFGVEPISKVLAAAGIKIAPEHLLRRQEQAAVGPNGS